MLFYSTVSIQRNSVGVYFRLDPIKDLAAQKLNTAVFNVLEWNTETCSCTAIWFRCFRAAQSCWQTDVLLAHRDCIMSTKGLGWLVI